MKTIMSLVMVAMLVGGAARAQETPKMPAPQKEHAWLKQLGGEWETESEAVMGPGAPPMRFKGTESVRTLGGFWSMAEMTSDMMGTPVVGVMTIGYDAKKKKYVGTWVCSMCDLLFQYEGTVDGNVLTLNTEGPHMVTGKLVKMRDVIEIKDRDHKVLTSSMLGEDGKWVPFMTMTSRRKK